MATTCYHIWTAIYPKNKVDAFTGFNMHFNLVFLFNFTSWKTRSRSQLNNKALCCRWEWHLKDYTPDCPRNGGLFGKNGWDHFGHFAIGIFCELFLSSFRNCHQTLPNDVGCFLMTALMKTCFASKLHEFWRFSKHTDPIDTSLKLSTTGAFSIFFGCKLGWPWVIGEQVTEHTALSHAHPAFFRK